VTISLKAHHEKREQLRAGLAQISDLRPGSLTARFRKCGKPNCKLSELLVGNPLYVSLDDSILAATATMLDHGTSWLPVVQTKGISGQSGACAEKKSAAP